MYAVMKTAPGVGNVELREIDEPVPGHGQVSIAVSAAGICGTDLHIYNGEYKSWPPVVLGHEVAGIVAEVGAEVDRNMVGQRVTTETAFFACGTCRWCRSGRRNICPSRRAIGSAVNGGFASHMTVPAINVHRLPDNVSLTAGALSEPLACVVHSTLEIPRVTPRDIAVISGPGAIGLLALQAARAAGARVLVLGTGADSHRLELAAQLGADAALNVEHDDYLGALDELSGGDGADIVFECSGSGQAARLLLDLVRRGGQFVQIGLFAMPDVWDLNAVVYKELRVTGGFSAPSSAWERALSLLEAGLVQTEPLVSGVFPLTDWREAFDICERKSGLKTVLQPVGAL